MNRILTVATLMFFTGAAHAAIVDGDFSSNTIDSVNATVGNLNTQAWTGRSGSYSVSGGVITQTGSGGSGTRFGQAFAAGDLTGTGWMLEVDVIGESGTDPKAQLYAGKLVASPPSGGILLTVGNNTGDNTQDGTGIVVGDAFTYLVNETFGTTGTLVFDISSFNLSAFDVMVFRINSTTSQNNNLKIGAVRLVNDSEPEEPNPVPAPAALPAGLMLLLLTLYRTRR